MNTKLVLAAVAAAAALSGCTHDATVSQPATEHVPATVTAAPKVISAAGPWQTMPDRPTPDTAPRDASGSQYGPEIRPGVGITSNGEGCTAGIALPLANPTLLFTAGHCVERVGADVNLIAGAAGGELSAVRIGTALDAGRAGSLGDIGVVQLDPTAPLAAGEELFAGRWKLDGILSAAEAQRLQPGTSICVDGSMSGVKCGRLTAAGERSARIAFTGAGLQEGDSGSPAWLVDANDHAVFLGLAVSTRETPSGPTARITYIDPVLAESR